MKKEKKLLMKSRWITVRIFSVVSIFLLSLFILFSISGCQKSESSKKMAKRIAKMEAGSRERSESRVKDLEKQIAGIEKDINKIITATEKKGTLHQTLAMKYLDMGMFGPALENFTAAIEINPARASLYYYRGVTLATMARTENDIDARMPIFLKVEQDYRQAIVLDSEYAPPYYSLAILYCSDLESLDRLREAAGLLDFYLERVHNHVGALILRGNLYAAERDLEAADRLYNSAAALTENDSEKLQITELREALWQ